MANRGYQLLCPIARALDTVGDRWALLILRDLHAGPARFGELEAGLGIATNLLTARLSDLIAAGLVQRSDDGVRSPYELTRLGTQTERLLWEMARFGSLLEREPAPRSPGNLRTVLIPLRMMLRAVDGRPNVTVLLRIDGEEFLIESERDDVNVRYRPEHLDSSPASVDVVIESTYDALLDVSEGQIDLAEFAERSTVMAGQDRAGEVLEMFARALAAPGD